MNNPKCAACGLPGHRFGRNEGVDRFDPMACINQLRGRLELLANGERAEPDFETGAAVFARHHGLPPERLSHGARRIVAEIIDAAVGGRLLVDPPKEEE